VCFPQRRTVALFFATVRRPTAGLGPPNGGPYNAEVSALGHPSADAGEGPQKKKVAVFGRPFSFVCFPQRRTVALFFATVRRPTAGLGPPNGGPYNAEVSALGHPSADAGEGPQKKKVAVFGRPFLLCFLTRTAAIRRRVRRPSKILSPAIAGPIMLKCRRVCARAGRVGTASRPSTCARH